MRNVWLPLIIVLIAGCAPIRAEQLRENPGGVHTFRVAADYQTVYLKILLHAQVCSNRGAFGDNAAVQGTLYHENNRSSVSITDSRTIGVSTLFTIDVARFDDNTTDVMVYYTLSRYKLTALLIEDWVKNNTPECTRGKVVPECAC